MRVTRNALVALTVFGALLFVQARSVDAGTCKKACNLVKRECIHNERDEDKQCKRACKENPDAGPACRVGCRDAYWFGKQICRDASISCRTGCRTADGSCAVACGAVARDCFVSVRTAGMACRADCKLTGRADRARCKIDFPDDPGSCLEQVGDAQSVCLDGCGATQATGYDACAADFETCMEDCGPPEQPPPGPCNDLSGPPVEQVEQSTKMIGVTVVTWNSSFVHLGYTCGAPINLSEGDLQIIVGAGAAEFVEFVDNKQHPFTPLSPDPATGVISPGPDVAVTFTGLHYDANCNVFIGNSHFKARIRVDKDGDGTLESSGDLGVNIHVEATADCP